MQKQDNLYFQKHNVSLDWNEYINTQTCIFKVPGYAKTFSFSFEPLFAFLYNPLW